jgi:uncharacterized protein YcnI
VRKIQRIFATYLAIFAGTFLSLGGVAAAHVAVKPGQVGVAAFQTYNVSVPVEKDIPTTALKLLVPAGVKEVAPTVKPGWQINVVRNTGGEATEINWTGGEIPAGFRDDFSFSAQAPDKAVDLKWKAYQTYADGSVVAWDQPPGISNESADKGPYSITKVVNDLTAPADGHHSASQPAKQGAGGAYILSVVALALAAAALARSIRSRR